MKWLRLDLCPVPATIDWSSAPGRSALSLPTTPLTVAVHPCSAQLSVLLLQPLLSIRSSRESEPNSVINKR